MSDWDASSYHRISGPQFEWGQKVLARLAAAPGERILDLGCGTGRLTSRIRSAVGNGRVVGLDRSRAMITVAGASADDEGRRIAYVQADGAALPFAAAFDAVFSAATLHWIPDHPRVFRGVHAALVPRGRFVAQCGGAGNLRRLLERAGRLMRSAEYAPFFEGWRDPWNFADAGATAERLVTAGFLDVHTWIEPAPVSLGDAAAFAEFIAVVCIRHHLDRLPPDRRHAFTACLADQFGGDDRPYELDYQRLNIDARKPAA
jgi:trans-aconitate methyltransferase